MTRLWAAVGILAILATLSDPVLAQAPGSGFDKGPLRVRPRRDLVFGDVLPGVSTRVDVLDPESGEWILQGTRFVEVQIDFLLPTQLDSGSDLMPIGFDTNAAGYADDGGGPLTVFDPNAGALAVFPNNGKLRINLGGTAQPKGTQLPGTYTAPVTLEVFYTGN
jgi:hypothetical protein